MVKNPERKAQTKSNLMDSFWTLYKKHSIEDLSVIKITEHAGYNRSTFYEYFMDVYDLLNQIESNLIEKLKLEMIKNLSNPAATDIVDRMAVFFEENGEYMSVLLGSKGDPAFVNKLKALIKPLLMKAMSLSEIDFDNQILFEFSLGGMLSALSYWYSDGKLISPEEYATIMRSLLMKGSLGVAREKMGVISLNP